MTQSYSSREGRYFIQKEKPPGLAAASDQAAPRITEITALKGQGKKGWVLIIVVLGAVGSLVKKLMGKKNKPQDSKADTDTDKTSA